MECFFYVCGQGRITKRKEEKDEDHIKRRTKQRICTADECL